MSPKPVLPPRARTALVLLAAGLTQQEIAGLMTISKSGVSSALATARKNLGATTNYHALCRAWTRGLFDEPSIREQIDS